MRSKYGSATLNGHCDAMIIKTQGGIQKRVDKKNQQWDETRWNISNGSKTAEKCLERPMNIYSEFCAICVTF